MSGQFKIGEIVVGQNFTVTTKYNGMEAEIIGGLEFRRARTSHGKLERGSMYRVQWADGKITSQFPHELRRKKPPKREIDTVVAWSDCAWRPAGVPA